MENNNLPKPNVPEAEEKDGGGDVSGSYTFKSMYDALPNNVSSNMSKNLSTPIAFVCLLYLANEKVHCMHQIQYLFKCLKRIKEIEFAVTKNSFTYKNIKFQNFLH